MKNFLAVAVALVVCVPVFGVVNNTVGEKTLTDCTVSFTSNPFNNSAPASVQTSCGYVYVNGHLKNGLLDTQAIIDMNTAINSGEKLDIKVTGILGLHSAYEITVAE